MTATVNAFELNINEGVGTWLWLWFWLWTVRAVNDTTADAISATTDYSKLCKRFSLDFRKKKENVSLASIPCDTKLDILPPAPHEETNISNDVDTAMIPCVERTLSICAVHTERPEKNSLWLRMFSILVDVDIFKYCGFVRITW